jgi:hypothetical protein
VERTRLYMPLIELSSPGYVVFLYRARLRQYKRWMDSLFKYKRPPFGGYCTSSLSAIDKCISLVAFFKTVSEWPYTLPFLWRIRGYNLKEWFPWNNTSNWQSLWPNIMTSIWVQSHVIFGAYSLLTMIKLYLFPSTYFPRLDQTLNRINVRI